MNRETFMETMAAEIGRRQDELIALETAFEKMGGVFDAPEPAPKMKLLTGPKSKKKKAKRKTAPPPVERGAKVSFTLNGHSIEMSARHRDVIEILQAAAGVPVAKRDLLACFVGPTPNWNQTQQKLNALLKPVAVQIVNVHGQGWKLEKL